MFTRVICCLSITNDSKNDEGCNLKEEQETELQSDSESADGAHADLARTRAADDSENADGAHEVHAVDAGGAETREQNRQRATDGTRRKQIERGSNDEELCKCIRLDYEYDIWRICNALWLTK